MNMDNNERNELFQPGDEFSRYSEYTDEKIVEMSHNGDSAAEEYLLDKYKNFVRSKARSYCSGRDDRPVQGDQGLSS